MAEVWLKILAAAASRTTVGSLIQTAESAPQVVKDSLAEAVAAYPSE